jgi:hypothetical protein
MTAAAEWFQALKRIASSDVYEFAEDDLTVCSLCGGSPHQPECPVQIARDTLGPSWAADAPVEPGPDVDPPIPAQPKPLEKVADLMDALEESVAAAKEARKRHTPPGPPVLEDEDPPKLHGEEESCCECGSDWHNCSDCPHRAGPPVLEDEEADS